MPDPDPSKSEKLRTLDRAFEKLRLAVERDEGWDEITRLAQRVVRKALDAKRNAD